MKNRIDSRRAYLDAVHTAMTQAGFFPVLYAHLDDYEQGWFQWTPKQHAVNESAWPAGLYVIWHHTMGWHYSTDRDLDVREPLPFTLAADPMDVADGVRRLLLGLTRDIPASTDDWAHAASLTATPDGPR
ncbi:hypothetical protein [Streptomyces sp. SGAir0957]